MSFESEDTAKKYWDANIKLVLSLLSIWAIVSFGCGILFVDFLNQVSFMGFKLGFWFAQQGSIYIFLILIFVYVKKSNALDEKYGVDE
jgi:putative solute:sodium symporter small subunit